MFNSNPYYNPNLYSQQNYLPSQQILQVNGKESLNGLRTAPNSSYLVADSTKPVIYKVVSDSLGNTNVSAFSVTPYKEEEEIKMDSIEQRMSSLEQQLSELRNIVQPVNDGFVSA